MNDLHAKLPRNTYTYKVFLSIRGRCINPHHKLYPKYGGAGIKLCPLLKHDFQGYKNFINAVGMAPSDKFIISRKNKELGFFGENLEWVERETPHTA